MQEELRILYELQSLDNEINNVEVEARAVPKRIEAIEEEIQLNKSVMERKENGLTNLVKSRRDKEKELENYEAGITKDKIKLMEVKTNKEYHAIQKEIEQHQQGISVYEEDILLMMDEIEQYEVEVKRAQSRFKIQKKELDNKIAEHKALLAGIPVRLSELKSKRDSMAENVAPDLIQRYLLTKSQRGGQAIAFIEKGICMACLLEIPPQTFNMIQKMEEIYTCPNCHRILYFPGKAKINDISS